MSRHSLDVTWYLLWEDLVQLHGKIKKYNKNDKIYLEMKGCIALRNFMTVLLYKSLNLLMLLNNIQVLLCMFMPTVTLETVKF